MTTETAEQLNQKIRFVYDAMDAAGVIAISPADLADKVLKNIDPNQDSPALVEVAATLELRQLARAICRRRQDESEHDAEQEELFDFKLQMRYPTTRISDKQTGSEDIFYVLRDHLTVSERRANSNRLRREGEAKIVHANLLDAETDHLISKGELISEDATATV
jgi:hypothetical protein